jgi:predicted ArsR family transcriptional regulator
MGILAVVSARVHVDDRGVEPVSDAAELVNIRPSTVKRHLADLRARSGLTTEQLIYAGRAEGWLVVPSLESG